MAATGTKKKKKTAAKPAKAGAAPAAGGSGTGDGYTVLARRYRSRSFDEVVGQEPIARTLRNAIASGRIAHAYLFCGTRGVGKTSMARIFANALNHGEGDAALEEQDAIEDAVLRGEDLDVIEIDGASNRGINEARDLIAGAGLAPARSRYRVYIIDEVHMLTREAFNALLKTMEEPPAHVKFILCTTDPQKVPATIQSRCQRFDFKPIPTRRIADHLRAVLDQESIEAEDGVVMQVARLGRGSMRDALSLLDRLIAASPGTIDAALAAEVLGLPDQALVDGVIDAVVAGDAGRGLAAGAALLQTGMSEESALELLAGRFRDLMVVAACGSDPAALEGVLDAGDEEREALARQAQAFDVDGLVHLLALCDAVARAARGSAVARALFDAATVRMCRAATLADVAALLDGTAPPAKKKSLSPPEPAAAATDRPASSVVEPKSAPPIRPDARAGDASPRTQGSSPVGPAADAPSRPAPDGMNSAAGGSAPAAVATAERPDDAPAVDDGPPLTAASAWTKVQVHVGDGAKAHVVRKLEAVSLEGDRLRLRPVVGAAAGFLIAQKDRLEALAREALGRGVRIEIDADPAPGGAPATTRAASGTAPAGGRGGIPTRPIDHEALRAAADLPLVKAAVEIFDAVVTDVRPDDDAAG